jgi:hypothetical protein
MGVPRLAAILMPSLRSPLADAPNGEMMRPETGQTKRAVPESRELSW